MRLQEKFTKTIVPDLQKQLSVSNPMAVPVVKKVVLNIGLGGALADRGLLDKAAAEMTAIAGQKAVITKARKSIASFKLREGNAIGVKVTLRGQRMYDFLEKLFTIVLPRLRDFQGLSSRSFDGQGNYTMGLEEQIVFPEIDYGKIDRIRGLELTLVTSASNDESAKALLTALGAPFEKEAETTA